LAAGKPVGPPQASIRFVADDVAVAKTYIEREGQQTVDGSELPVRHNHSLKVLVNRDRRWQIDAQRYPCRVKPTGGLKLQLDAVSRDDRRLRSAPVSVASVGGEDEIMLVTDSRGRLRYRLTAGNYRLHVQHAPEISFAVGENGWTPVRVRLH
jgi:hypothetical protein